MSIDEVNYKYMYQPIIRVAMRFYGQREIMSEEVFRSEDLAKEFAGKFREKLILDEKLHPKDYRSFKVNRLKIRVV